MTNTKFLPNVIKYDRYQPEFYEDTKTYVSKRSSAKKVNKGVNFYSKNKDLINFVSKKFDIEKELLLSLIGIGNKLWYLCWKNGYFIITCNIEL